MSTSSVTGTGYTYTAADAANTTARVPQKNLGQDDFLKLITVQLAKQDPMKPMEDTAFIAQMANFSALEAQNTLAKEMGYLRADTQMQAANGMLGREVTVATTDGDITGVVDSVSADSSSVYVNVGGQQYSFSSVTSVKPAPVPAAEVPAA
jgi:flagellar basal-body rod modification protein FlgD